MTNKRTLVITALAAGMALLCVQSASAFNADRASWLNYLQEQRRSSDGTRDTVPTQGTEGARRGEVLRPGVVSAMQRGSIAAPQRQAAPRRSVRRTGMRQVSRQMDPRFLPRTVRYDGPHGPGTVVIDTSDKFLYLVQSNGKARRYGVGVGRPGFQWSGTHRISMKREWPGWTPPAAMRRRQPELPAYMPGGPDNPLGARALYLGSTLYRIHGSNAPWSIGHEVSSGCIRMRNEDVVDLYRRVGVGTRVVVRP